MRARKMIFSSYYCCYCRLICEYLLLLLVNKKKFNTFFVKLCLNIIPLIDPCKVRDIVVIITTTTTIIIIT